VITSKSQTRRDVEICDDEGRLLEQGNAVLVEAWDLAGNVARYED
jgi:hypothetical protein